MKKMILAMMVLGVSSGAYAGELAAPKALVDLMPVPEKMDIEQPIMAPPKEMNVEKPVAQAPVIMVKPNLRCIQAPCPWSDRAMGSEMLPKK